MEDGQGQEQLSTLGGKRRNTSVFHTRSPPLMRALSTRAGMAKNGRGSGVSWPRYSSGLKQPLAMLELWTTWSVTWCDD